MCDINFAVMDDETLKVATFGEGIPPILDDTSSEEKLQTITVFMNKEKTETPFGMIVTAPFLELFWRNTGADCDGEEEDMKFPDGKVYHVTLHDTQK
jgi:hypothetical protein